MRYLITAIALLSLVMGCGGASENNESQSTSQTAAKPHPSDNPKGIGPITEVTLGPIDEELAAAGAEVFDTKCTACHKMGERYVGPALAGVTERRQPEWILNMILNPDQMIKEDAQAKKLFVEYLTPMTFQNVTEEDAHAILMYLRSNDATASASDTGASE